jgi:hypothetical protein
MTMAKRKLNSATTPAAVPDDWETRNDLDTLMAAHKIHSDPKRHAKAKALAKAKMMSMARVATAPTVPTSPADAQNGTGVASDMAPYAE